MIQVGVTRSTLQLQSRLLAIEGLLANFQCGRCVKVRICLLVRRWLNIITSSTVSLLIHFMPCCVIYFRCINMCWMVGVGGGACGGKRGGRTGRQMDRFGNQGLVSARNITSYKETALAYAIREKLISFAWKPPYCIRPDSIYKAFY